MHNCSLLSLYSGQCYHTINKYAQPRYYFESMCRRLSRRTTSPAAAFTKFALCLMMLQKCSSMHIYWAKLAATTFSCLSPWLRSFVSCRWLWTPLLDLLLNFNASIISHLSRGTILLFLVTWRIDWKIALLVFKCLHDLGTFVSNWMLHYNGYY